MAVHAVQAVGVLVAEFVLREEVSQERVVMTCGGRQVPLSPLAHQDSADQSSLP
jgi:hypothetical protein